MPPAAPQVWVAQRVPDEHFALVANRYIIRDVLEQLPDDATQHTRACRGDEFRHSSNLFAVATHLASLEPNPRPLENLPPARRGVRPAPGGVDGRRVVDWLVHFGGDDKVELAPYTNDRLWRMLEVFAPYKHWEWPPPTPLATDIYPFSAAPSKPLTRSAFIGLSRDVFRGVKHESLDLTKGLASGPFGDPSRYDVPSAFTPPGLGGSFPRAISMFRTSYSHVTEIGRKSIGDPGGQASRPVGARVWTSQGAPHASVYSPLHMLPAFEGDDSGDGRRLEGGEGHHDRRLGSLPVRSKPAARQVACDRDASLPPVATPHPSTCLTWQVACDDSTDCGANTGAASPAASLVRPSAGNDAVTGSACSVPLPYPPVHEATLTRVRALYGRR